MKNYIIYLATSPSGKVYVGATSDGLKLRKQTHISLAKSNKRRVFQCALKKYNFNFKWEILEEGLTREEAEIVEKYYIAFFNSTDRQFGYNISPGGLAGKIQSPEGEARRKAKMAEHYKDPEFIKKLSELRKGRVPWNKGFTKENDPRVKLIGEKNKINSTGNTSHLGFKATPEQIENLSKSHLGQTAWNKGLTKEDPRVFAGVSKMLAKRPRGKTILTHEEN